MTPIQAPLASCTPAKAKSRGQICTYVLGVLFRHLSISTFLVNALLLIFIFILVNGLLKLIVYQMAVRVILVHILVLDKLFELLDGLLCETMRVAGFGLRYLEIFGLNAKYVSGRLLE